jgi:hypothetical protein
MLKIRSEHVDALASDQAAGFAARMAAHLRELFPAKTARLDDEHLRLLADRVRVQAARWGINQEAQVERLLELFVGFELLRRRPRPEWISEIVEYPGRPGEEILLRLEQELIFGAHH